MAEPVEGRRQVRVENPPAVRVTTRNRAEDRLDRVMAAAARPKAVGPRFEPRLPLGFQGTEDDSLQGSVRDDGDGRFILPLLSWRVGIFLFLGIWVLLWEEHGSRY